MRIAKEFYFSENINAEILQIYDFKPVIVFSPFSWKRQ